MTTSDLSSAFAQTIAQGQAPAGTLRTLMNAWPAGSWSATQGDPSPLVALAQWKPLKGGLFEEQQQAWADLAEAMIDQHGPVGLGPLLVGLIDASTTGVNEPLARVFLDRSLRARPLLPKVRNTVLMRALDLGWAALSGDLLRALPAPAMTGMTETDNPFARVRTLSTFNALIEAGYNPYMPTASGQDSTALLRLRQIRDDNHPNGFSTANDRAAIMRRLTELAEQQPLASRLDQVIRHGQRWTELQSELRAVGPAAWAVRFDGGGTLLHHLALHQPQWIASLFRWPGFKTAPDELFSTLDDLGAPSLMYRWLVKNLRNKNGKVIQDEDAWWNEIKDLPAAHRWVQAMPTLPPGEPIQRFLRAAIRVQCLPNLKPRSGLHAESGLWRHLMLMGSYSSISARQDFAHNAELQALYDQAVWDGPDTTRRRRGDALNNLMDWNVWQTPTPVLDSPWMANQFMMLLLDEYLAESTITGNDERFLRGMEHAFAAGASPGWVLDKIERGLTDFRPDAIRDPRQLWQRATLVHQRSVLQATFEETPETRSVVRARL